MTTNETDPKQARDMQDVQDTMLSREGDEGSTPPPSKGSPLEVDFSPEPDYEGGDAAVRLNVATALVNREAGASLVDEVWGNKPNVEYIVSRLHNNKDLRTEITQAFMNGSMEKVYLKLNPRPTQRAGSLVCTPPEVHDAVLSVIADPIGATIVTDMVTPLLHNIGAIANSSRFTVRRRVPFGTPTIADISTDLLGQELERTINGAYKTFDVPNSGVHSTSVIAVEFAETFRAIGVALSIMNSYEDVLTDIVLGVMANIDTSPSATQRGSVSRELMMHPVVQSLSTNWTFVKEALTLRAEFAGQNGPSAGFKQLTSDYLFNKYSTIVETMVKGSKKYQMVPRSAFVDNIGTYKVLDLEGRPVSTVLYDNAVMEPTAMAVISVDDYILPGAKSLQEMPDRVSERLMTSYGEISGQLTVKKSARALQDILALKAETNEEIKPLYKCRMDELDKAVDLETLAVMMADAVTVRFDLSQDVKKAYRLIYTVSCDYPNLRLNSGKVIAGKAITADPTELLLAMKERESSKVVDVPPQLIPRTALRTRLLATEPNDFVKSTERGGYRLNALNVKVKGVIKLKELMSIRMGDLATLVSPYYNARVYKVNYDIITEMFTQAKAIKEEVHRRSALRKVAKYTLDVAQSLADGFKREIHDNIVERAAVKLSYEESVAMRAQLRQSSMKALSDVIALGVWAKLHGLIDDDSIFHELAADKDIVAYWAEHGSDE